MRQTIVHEILENSSLTQAKKNLTAPMIPAWNQQNISDSIVSAWGFSLLSSSSPSIFLSLSFFTGLFVSLSHYPVNTFAVLFNETIGMNCSIYRTENINCPIKSQPKTMITRKKRQKINKWKTKCVCVLLARTVAAVSTTTAITHVLTGGAQCARCASHIIAVKY